MTTLVVKRGDLLPNLTATLTDDGAPVDLTGADSIRAVGVQNGLVVIDRAVTGNAAGEVTLTWQAGETDDIGYIRFEFIVTQGGREQTFPYEGSVKVRIAMDGA